MEWMSRYLEQDVYRILLSHSTCLKHGKTALHEEDQIGPDQCPQNIDIRVRFIHSISRRLWRRVKTSVVLGSYVKARKPQSPTVISIFVPSRTRQP